MGITSLHSPLVFSQVCRGSLSNQVLNVYRRSSRVFCSWERSEYLLEL